MIKDTGNVQKAFDRLFESAVSCTEKCIIDAGGLVTETAAELCSDKRTEDLMSFEQTNRLSVTVNAAGEAAVKAEFGTEDYAPSPFIVPAAEQSRSQIQKNAVDIFKNGL